MTKIINMETLNNTDIDKLYYMYLIQCINFIINSNRIINKTPLTKMLKLLSRRRNSQIMNYIAEELDNYINKNDINIIRFNLNVMYSGYVLK